MYQRRQIGIYRAAAAEEKSGIKILLFFSVISVAVLVFVKNNHYICKPLTHQYETDAENYGLRTSDGLQARIPAGTSVKIGE